jgi:hypothetical protein
MVAVVVYIDISCRVYLHVPKMAALNAPIVFVCYAVESWYKLHGRAQSNNTAEQTRDQLNLLVRLSAA